MLILQNILIGFSKIMNQIHLRSNDIVSGILHLIGALCAIAVLVVLIVLSNDAYHIVGYTLYGVGLILLYSASTLYHLWSPHSLELKSIFRRLDHAMIYILIAATYTPITFLALSGGWKWSMFGVIWGLALVGFLAKFLIVNPSRMAAIASTVLYVVMGWLIVIAIVPLIAGMSTAAFVTLVCGGVAYTVGAVFFALDAVLPKRKHFWMHEIFHLLVLAGSALHTITMFLML